MKYTWGGGFVLCVAMACAGDPDVSSVDRSVVGGRAETAYPAVGYMMIGPTIDALDGPYCGATLVAPRVAVTAAHCVVGSTNKKFGIGLGQGDGFHVYPATRVQMHETYDGNGSYRYQHDLAALILDQAPPVTPAVVTAASDQQVARYVGYGRVTPGDYDRSDGYTGERKSAAQRVTYKGGLNLWTSGVDGGLCWGDSGGPLLGEGTNQILGVLADFDGSFYCNTGNAMIFTSLWGERDWIASVVECAEAGGEACAPACQYRCDTYSYADNECRDGWFCDGRCVTNTGCDPAEVCQYACADYNYGTTECRGGWQCDGRCLDYKGSC